MMKFIKDRISGRLEELRKLVVKLIVCGMTKTSKNYQPEVVHSFEFHLLWLATTLSQEDKYIKLIFRLCELIDCQRYRRVSCTPAEITLIDSRVSAIIGTIPEIPNFVRLKLISNFVRREGSIDDSA